MKPATGTDLLVALVVRSKVERCIGNALYPNSERSVTTAGDHHAAFDVVRVRPELPQKFRQLGGQDGGASFPQLVVVGLAVALDRRLLEGSVHALDAGSSPGQAPAIRPRMVRLGEPMLDVVSPADLVEAVDAVRIGRAATVPGKLGELDAVVGRDYLKAVRAGLDQGRQDGAGDRPIGLVAQPGEGVCERPVDDTRR